MPADLAELATDVGAEAFVLDTNGAALDIFGEDGATVGQRCDGSFFPKRKLGCDREISPEAAISGGSDYPRSDAPARAAAQERAGTVMRIRLCAARCGSSPLLLPSCHQVDR